MRRFVYSILPLTMLAMTVATANAAPSDGVTISPVKLATGNWIANMSDNGKWAVSRPVDNDEVDCSVTVFDIENGKLKSLPSDQPEGGVAARTMDITNDGQTVVGMYAGQPGYYTVANHCWNKFPLPAPVRRWSGEATCVSTDGKVAAGWVNQAWGMWDACAWRLNDEGEYEIITLNLPKNYDDLVTQGVISQSIADACKKDDRLKVPNYGMHAISSDGRYIHTSLNRNSGAGGSFLYDVVEGKIVLINGKLQGDFLMSNNGRYIYTGGMYSSDFDEEVSYGSHVYDRETGKSVAAPSDGTCVDNFGNVLCENGYEPGLGFRGQFCVSIDGVEVDLKSVLKQKYDIDFSKTTGYSTTGWPVAVSDDGKTAVVMTEMREQCYAITLPETFAEAFKGVNVMNSYSVLPTPNQKLAHLESTFIQFDRDAEITPDRKAYIKHGDQTIAESVSIAPVGSSKTIFEVKFPVCDFEFGETYDVIYPEGCWYLKGTDFVSPEVKFSYFGREDGPVQVVSFQPNDGSAISSFSQSEAVGVKFNTLVIAGRPAEQPAIYEVGSTSPLSRLSYVVMNGNILGLYPPAALTLPEGLHYEVRIPANTVTDPAGFCGNEPIVMHIDGAYIRETAGYFFEDFTNTNTALQSFMQYEGDHYLPSQSMEAWGFDTDNTPWNFSVHDGDYDYCAASHSIYDPAGQSDDWMVIPQIALKGTSNFLSFKGQSYRSACTDKLKIIVWENDNMYNSLSKDVVDKMKEEGHLLAEVTLDPGRNEESLANEWTEYKFSLAEYAGKNIYIAFVNNNYDQSAIFLDDIRVDSEGLFTATTSMANNVINNDDMAVSLTVRSKSDEPYTNIKATYINKTNGSTGTYEANDINLEKNKRLTIDFTDKVKLEKGTVNNIDFEVEMNGEVVGFSHVVKNLTKELRQNVMIEEGTGAWCGNCPLGYIAFEEIRKLHGDQLVPVAIHAASTQGDPYDFAAYCQTVGINAFPIGLVNRNGKQVLPYDNYQMTTSKGATWYDQFLAETKEPAECSINIDRTVYSIEDDAFFANAEVEFALSRDNVYYNIFTVIMEDELPIVQHNYFSSITEDVFPYIGEWGVTGKLGAQGGQAETTCDHVARGIAGTSFSGEGGYIPRSVAAGKKYKASIRIERPTLYADEHFAGQDDRYKNVSIACAIVDISTGKIINSTFVKGVPVEATSSVGQLVNNSDNFSFTAANGAIYANGSTEGVEVYTIQGVRVVNAGLNGLYIAKKGNKVTKLIVR